MQILLPSEVEQQIVAALKQAGQREIGGILMGECVADAVYRICDLTIQRHGGNFASFVRLIQGILDPLNRFFRETGYNYTQFNYLGEWHSHPAFDPKPSSLDCGTMWAIVEDPKVGANFAVLMVVQLDKADRLEGTMTVFLPGRRMFEGKLIREGAKT